MSFHIIGTGSALPERCITNDDLSQFLDTTDEWIFTRTGIKERRVCTFETLDDLACAASLRALEAADVTASELDLIVCATSSFTSSFPFRSARLSAPAASRLPASENLSPGQKLSRHGEQASAPQCK